MLGSAFGSTELPSAGWIPFCNEEEGEELAPLSAGALPTFSVIATLLSPFTRVEVPGSVLRAPRLVTCGAFGNLAGDEWFVIGPFAPCELRVGVEEEFKEVAVEVAEAFAVVGDDNKFELLALPILCFFLDFFSLSFSPLQKLNKNIALQYCRKQNQKLGLTPLKIPSQWHILLHGSIQSLFQV